MRAIVRQRRPGYESDWKQLTTVQQNLLRAVASEGSGLARLDVRRRYGLGEASNTSRQSLDFISFSPNKTDSRCRP